MTSKLLLLSFCSFWFIFLYDIWFYLMFDLNGFSQCVNCVFSAGKDEAFSQECPDSSSKPKQLKFPNQVYIDLPLWRDEQQPQSSSGNNGLGDPGVGAGSSGGLPETPDDPSTTTSTSSASTTPQLTPTNSLKRASARRKTDSALYGCGTLLASVVLGYDIREAIKNAAPGEESEPPKEEKKKKEGLFQRATRFRRSTSPPGIRPRKEDLASNHNATQAVNLVSMSAIMECNSTKCLLQPEAEVSDSGSAKPERVVTNHHMEPSRPGRAAFADKQNNKTAAEIQKAVQTPSQLAEQNNHNTGTRLRRKKYTTNHSGEFHTAGGRNAGSFPAACLTLLFVHSQRPAHRAPSRHAEEAGKRERRKAAERSGRPTATARVFPGQASHLGPAASPQQELLPGSLLRREGGSELEHGAVLRAGLLPARHGRRGTETGLHRAALPHPELPGTAFCFRAGERVPLLTAWRSEPLCS